MQTSRPVPLRRLLSALSLVLLVVASACQKTTWTKVVSTDGSTTIGELVDSRPDAVVVRTSDGRQVTILRSRIRSVGTPSTDEIAAAKGTSVQAAATTTPPVPQVPPAQTSTAPEVPESKTVRTAPIVPSSGRSARTASPSSPPAESAPLPASPPAEPLPSATPARTAPAVAEPPERRPSMVMAARLETALASDDSEVDDDVEATLVNPVVVDGRQLVPAGALVKGTVVESGKNGEGKPQLAVRFTAIERGEDDTIPIQSSIVRWTGSVQQVPAAEAQSSFMGKVKKGLGMKKSGMVTVIRQARVAQGTPIEIALEAPISPR